MRGRPTPLADPLLTVVMPIYNERATVEITNTDVENYTHTVQDVLGKLFKLRFVQ